MPHSSPKALPLSLSMAGGCNVEVQAVKNMTKMEEQLVHNLCDPELRESALAELSKVPPVVLCLFLIRRSYIPLFKILPFLYLARFLARNSCCCSSRSSHLVTLCSFLDYYGSVLMIGCGSWCISVSI